MTDEQNPHSRKTPLDGAVLIGSIAYTLLLIASHWFYLGNIHHRIGGVAWNSLFQIFGNFFAIFVAISILAATFAGRISRWRGFFSATLLGLTAGYCFFRSFGMMMSI